MTFILVVFVETVVNMSSFLIDVQNVTKVFGDMVAVDQVSFSIPKGEIVAIVGPNGSGKSTLVKMIAGLIPPTSGTIRIDGQSPADARRKMAYVPQQFSFDKTLPITVEEFLHIAVCETKEHTSESAIARVLAFVGLADHRHKRLGALSGGQLQRILIARALLHKRQLLILDEPSTGVDVSAEKEIYTLLHTMNKEQGTTIVIISHELDFVTSFAHTVLCLNKEKVCYGSVVDMLGDPKVLQKLYGSVVPIYTHKHDHI